MSMIRVLFCTLLAAWAVLPLRADDRGRALVRSLSAKIASYASYEVLFTADMDGESIATASSSIRSVPTRTR